MVGLNSLWRRQQQRPTEEAGADPGPAPTPTATVASASDVSTIASASTVTTDPTPQQPRPLPPNAGNSEHERMLSAAAAASAAVAVASAGADDKAHGGVASMEGEEVVKVKRGGSQGSSGNHGKQPRPQSQRGLVKQEDEEGKVEQAGASPAPGLEAQRKARSLPTVLRSSHRGDWRLLLRRLQRGGGGRYDSEEEDDEGENSVPKAPPSMISSLQSGVHSVRTFLHEMEDRFHRMPKWQYRCLIGSLVVCVCALGLVTIITIVYGFGMSYPHIALVKLELALPFPHLDRDGSIPVLASVEFNNPNAFRVRTEPATVKIYTMPHRSPDTLLGQTSVPAMALRANGEGYQTPADFAIRNVGNVKGGQAVVDAVLQGAHSFLYTETEMDIVVKSLGFMPIHRTFNANCKILKIWGGAESDVLLSDCYGQFGRRTKNKGDGVAGHRRLRGA